MGLCPRSCRSVDVFGMGIWGNAVSCFGPVQARFTDGDVPIRPLRFCQEEGPENSILRRTPTPEEGLPEEGQVGKIHSLRGCRYVW